MHRRTVLLAVTLLVAAACGGEDGGPAAPDVAAGTGAASATVAVADSPLGEILVDGEGRTLYLFVPDDAGVPTCAGDCADAWPPFAGPAEPGEGVDAGMLATAERDDGTPQVTYGGWPLYLFAGDEEPGDVNGQGLNDVWFVVGPDGEAVEAAAADAEAGGTGAGGTGAGGTETDETETDETEAGGY